MDLKRGIMTAYELKDTRLIHYSAGKNMPTRIINVPADQYAQVVKCLMATGCIVRHMR